MKVFVFLILFLNSIYVFSKDLMVGVITGAPPFSEMSDSGDHTYFYGFSIDIMNNICKQLNVGCVFSPLTMQTQFEALNLGKVDVLILATPYQVSHLRNYSKSHSTEVSNENQIMSKFKSS